VSRRNCGQARPTPATASSRIGEALRPTQQPFEPGGTHGVDAAEQRRGGRLTPRGGAPLPRVRVGSAVEVEANRLDQRRRIVGR
jgi:hypothetical protein